MSGVIAVHLGLREAVLADDRRVPITNMLDVAGEETDEPSEAVAVVCGQELEWYAVDLREFDEARVH